MHNQANKRVKSSRFMGGPLLGLSKNGTNLRKTMVYNNYCYVQNVGNGVN